MTDAPRITVLIIDDNPVDRQTYRRFLEEASPAYLVHEARDGRSGLDAVDLLQPDCVLLDLKLTDQSGYEVLDRLAGEGSLRRIPVVMLSGLTMKALADGARSLGAHSYLIKGRFDKKELDNTVRAALACERGQ